MSWYLPLALLLTLTLPQDRGDEREAECLHPGAGHTVWRQTLHTVQWPGCLLGDNIWGPPHPVRAQHQSSIMLKWLAWWPCPDSDQPQWEGVRGEDESQGESSHTMSMSMLNIMHPHPHPEVALHWLQHGECWQETKRGKQRSWRVIFSSGIVCCAYWGECTHYWECVNKYKYPRKTFIHFCWNKSITPQKRKYI